MNRIYQSIPVKNGLVLAYLPFARTLLDHSGLGHVLTTTGRWARRSGVNGLDFSGAGTVTTPHAADLSPSAYSCFIAGEFDPSNVSTFFYKLGAAGRIQFYLTGGGASMSSYDGTTGSSLVVDISKARSIGTSLGNGQKPDFVSDGVIRGQGNVAITVPPTNQQMFFLGVGAPAVPCTHAKAFLFYNDVKTADEWADLHTWSESLTSPSLPADRRYFDMGSVVPTGSAGGEVGAWDLGLVSARESADRSGAGHHASIHGPAAPLPTELGSALGLDGTAGYVSIPDHADFSFGDGSDDSPFSVEAWIRMDDATGFPIISKGIYNTSGEWRLLVSAADDKLYFQCFDESVADCYIGRMYNTALTSTEGSWLHVVATYDGGGLSGGIIIYLNGSPVDDADAELGVYVAMEPGVADVHIGRDDTTYGEGAVKDARVVGRVLTPAEVEAGYAQRARKVMYEQDFSMVAPTLANVTVGQMIPGTQLRVITGIFATLEDATGPYLSCVGAGKLREQLPGADHFATALFDATGTAALTKNAGDIEIDCGAGDTVRAVRLTLGVAP